MNIKKVGVEKWTNEKGQIQNGGWCSVKSFNSVEESVLHYRSYSSSFTFVRSILTKRERTNERTRTNLYFEWSNSAIVRFYDCKREEAKEDKKLGVQGTRIKGKIRERKRIQWPLLHISDMSMNSCVRSLSSSSSSLGIMFQWFVRLRYKFLW